MKSIAVNINYDDEKLTAVKMYMEQKSLTLEDELNKAMDTLYTKYVPAGVREFIEMQNGAVAPKFKSQKPKPHKPVVDEKLKSSEKADIGE